MYTYGPPLVYTYTRAPLTYTVYIYACTPLSRMYTSYAHTHTTCIHVRASARTQPHPAHTYSVCIYTRARRPARTHPMLTHKPYAYTRARRPARTHTMLTHIPYAYSRARRPPRIHTPRSYVYCASVRVHTPAYTDFRTLFSIHILRASPHARAGVHRPPPRSFRRNCTHVRMRAPAYTDPRTPLFLYQPCPRSASIFPTTTVLVPLPRTVQWVFIEVIQ